MKITRKQLRRLVESAANPSQIGANAYTVIKAYHKGRHYPESDEYVWIEVPENMVDDACDRANAFIKKHGDRNRPGDYTMVKSVFDLIEQKAGPDAIIADIFGYRAEELAKHMHEHGYGGNIDYTHTGTMLPKEPGHFFYDD